MTATIIPFPSARARPRPPLAPLAAPSAALERFMDAASAAAAACLAVRDHRHPSLACHAVGACRDLAVAVLDGSWRGVPPADAAAPVEGCILALAGVVDATAGDPAAAPFHRILAEAGDHLDAAWRHLMGAGAA